MRLWGGFIEGKLDIQWIDDGFGGENRRWVPALFLTNKEARQQYEDVRKVEPKGTITKTRVIA